MKTHFLFLQKKYIMASARLRLEREIKERNRAGSNVLLWCTAWNKKASLKRDEYRRRERKLESKKKSFWFFKEAAQSQMQ
jgi:hypothetical protein